MSPAEYREVLGHYPSGVCVIASRHPDGTLSGITVNSFTSASLDPPLVAFFAGRHSFSWRKIHESGRFCANVLAADQQWVCHRFASRRENKFSGVGYQISTHGTPILEGVVASIECHIESVTEAGDHHYVLGKVLNLEANASRRPLIRFQKAYGEFQRALLDQAMDLPGAVR